MIRRLRAHLTYANVMATIAVFVALGGSSYAALKLPRDSVGNGQIRTGAVRSSEIRDRSIRTSDLSTSTRASLRGQTGPEGPAGSAGAQGPQGPAGPTYWAAIDSGGGQARGNAVTSNHDAGTGMYRLRFPVNVAACGAAATLAAAPGGQTTDPPAGRITVAPDAPGIVVRTFDAAGAVQDLPFNVIIACS